MTYPWWRPEGEKKQEELEELRRKISFPDNSRWRSPFEVWDAVGRSFSEILHRLPSQRFSPGVTYEELQEPGVELPFTSPITGERARLGTKGLAEFTPDIVALSPVPGNIGLKAFRQLAPPEGTGLATKIGSRIGQAAVSPLAAVEKAQQAIAKPFTKGASLYERQLEAHRIARDMNLGRKEYEQLAKSVTGKASMKNMSVSEADKFLDAMGRREIELPFAGVSNETAKTKAKLVARELAEYVGGKPAKSQVVTRATQQKGIIQKIEESTKGFLERTYRVERILERADGYPEFPRTGKMTQTFWNPVEKASDEKLVNVYGKINEFRTLLASQNTNLNKMLAKQVAVKDVPLTTGERMGIYLHSKNPDNLLHLKRGNLGALLKDKGDAYVDDFIKQAADSLSPDEKATADWIFKQWQADTPKMAEAFKAATGKTMKVVENYVPIVVRGEVVTLDDAISKEVMFRYTRKYPSTMIKKGFTKARTGKAIQDMELDVIKLWLDRLPEAEHYKLFSPIIRDMQRIYLNPTFKASYTGKHGRAEYEVIGQWMKDVAATNPLKARQFSERLLQQFRVNATTAVLGFNITTALKQFPSYFIGMAEIGEMPALRGLFKSVVDRKGTTALVKRLAPQIWKRSFEREVAEAKLLRSIEGRIRDKLSPKELFMIMTTSMDRLAVNGLWRGAFDDAIRKGLPEKVAAQWATRAIRRTQPFFGAKDIPEFYRSGEFMKALVMFTNQLNQYWNYYIFDVAGRAGAGKISGVDVARKVIEGFVIPALMIGWISRSKPQENVREILTDIGTMGLSSIPVVGNYLASGLRGFRDTQGLVTTEVMDTLQKLAYSANQEQWDKLPELMAQIGGYATGIPTGQPIRTIKGILDLAQDKTDDWLQLIWGSSVRKSADDARNKARGNFNLRKRS